MTRQRTLTAAHWGVYEVEYDEAGKATRLHPFAKDPDPSPIGLHMLSDEVTRLRVRRPAVRKSWLEHGPGSHPERRGQEPFVELAWGEALDLLAKELARVKSTWSNRAIFGGSYGWSSAGRFHHAQSQVHRFLNSIGGYVRHQDSYSLGAARVLMPHIVAPMDELMSMHTSWDVLAEHCKLFVCFGGVPRKNSQINAGGATLHHVKGGLYAMREKGVRFVNVTPTADDLDYHMSTLFPPVRPRGHLELRVIDAQPGDGWIVPTAVVSALLDDPVAAEVAMAAVEPLQKDCRPGDLLLRAARLGQDDPQLAAASRECFAAADSALSRLGAPAAIRDAVGAFADRYVLRGRCPADDRLDEARAAARYPYDRLPYIPRNPDACLEDSP